MKVEEVHKDVVEVEKLIAGILIQLDALTKGIDTLTGAHGETVHTLADLRLQHERELVALAKDIDELRRWTDKNSVSALSAQIEVLKEKVAKLEALLDKVGTRAWSVVPNVAGAIVNVLLAAVVAFIVTKLTR